MIIFIAGLVVLGSIRTKGQVQRSLNMSLLLIKVPRESAESNQGEKKSPKELINVAEQLISSFANIHSKGWNKFIYGEPYIALEIAVHHLGEETHFYLSVPRSNEDAIEKQLYAYFPTAEIMKVKDYNIFNPEGVAVGSSFTFSEDPILPFRTYQKLEADPLSAILTSISKLQANGEGAAIQLLIRPSHAKKHIKLANKVAREMQSGYQFKEALGRAKHPPKLSKPDPNKPFQPEKPKTVSPIDDEIIKAISAKTGKQIFDVNLRLLSSAVSEPRANDILSDLEGAFVQYSGPGLNGLKPHRLSGNSLKKLIFNYSFRLFDNKQKLIMSTEEITSIYHMPLSVTAAPNVKFLKAKQAEPPSELPSDGIVIGYNNYRGIETPIRLSVPDRQRHMYIIGQTGTGKTVAMQAMVRQDIESGRGVCVIDPHGQFADWVLSIVPKERADDVVYFNPGDVERPMGLNLLEIDPTKPEQKTFISNEFFTIMKTIYKELPEAFGPMFEQYWKNSVLLLLDDYQNQIPTLAEVPRVFSDEAFRRDKLSRETNPLVKSFWEQEAEKAGGEAALANMTPYITSKLSPFLANDYLRPIVAQQKSAFDFREIMDKQKIFVINLSKGRIGERNAYLLGMVIVSRLSMMALSRVDMDESQRKDFYLYIDEFQNFITPSIATILSEARKYKLDLILANQYLKQLPEEIKDAVFGNVGNLITCRISPDDAEFMKNKFEPVFSVQDIINIDNLNAYVNILINGRPSRPFNIRLPLNEYVKNAGSKEVGESVKELSRLKFGRPREEIEAEIRSRYSFNN